MRKGLFLLLSMTLSYLSMAQVPNSFSYQMVIRNGNNELVANTTVGIRIGLLGGNAADTVWYEEEHKIKTNLNGLAYITIGKGNILKGGISTIDWTKGPFFIKSETDPTGGTNYSLIIVSQMLSVPYAIYAKTAEKLSTPVTESDPLFNKSVAKGITSEDTARWSKKEIYDGNSGGGGITNESDPVFSTSVAKGIRSVDTAAWNNKLNLRDTMSMLRPYLRASDTASLSNRLNQKVDLQQLNTNTLTLDGKINIADTAGMLANYRTGINTKVNIADTLNMLIPYLRDADTANMLTNYRLGINTKVNIADTARMLLPYLRGADTSSMLANYRTGINEKVNIADTAGMLMPYLRKQDTISVSDRINLKVNIADTAGMLTPYLRKLDTASVSNRINLKVNIADTAGMLNPYLRKLDTASVSDRINLKVNIADTAGMLIPYLRKLDTASVSDRINLKVNIADTAGMLTPYLRKLDTASVSNRINLKVNIADTAGMLTPYLRKLDTSSVSNRINLKVNIADTAGMLTPYFRKLDTASVSNRINTKVNIADTAGMLIPYLRKLDTASVSNRINLKVNIADTAGMLTPYFRKLDTASVSDRINLKVNIADTAGMLTPYLRKLDTASVSDRINTKVNILDTASMLEPYLREPESLVNGDILFYNNNKWIRLPIGQEGQFLTVNTGIPTWVSVSTAPGPPTGVSATAGNVQATVSFTAPLNSGGSAITGYTVISNPGGVTATGSSSPLTVTGLTNGISYTFTVVATNAVGNSVASSASTAVTPVVPVCPASTVTDIDNNMYNTVAIGTQCWTKENLRVSRYNDGTGIPNETANPAGWYDLTTGARSEYDATGVTDYVGTYGYLYNWYAVNDSRKLCPAGWHVPTDAEWTNLIQFIDPTASAVAWDVQSSTAGAVMKSTSTLWDVAIPPSPGTNTSGFSALPGGIRDSNGTFHRIRIGANFWSTTVYADNGLYAWQRTLYNYLPAALRYHSTKTIGMSIRCLKD